MSIFQCYYAKPGNYKSLYFAILINRIYLRNKIWYEKQYKQYEFDLFEYQVRMERNAKIAYLGGGIPKNELIPVYPKKRRVATNMRLSEAQIKLMGEYLFYWSDLEQVIQLKDCDLVIDEIAEFFDAREFEMMSRSVKKFLSQYRRLGIYIYGNTQHWSMIDKRARLMFTHVFKMVKVIGNSDPSPTRPPIKSIWGFGLVLPVENFESDDEKMMKLDWFGFKHFFVNRQHIEMYDTREIISNREYPPLKHIVRKCEFSDDINHKCDFCKITHI
jgi:hypothetical protein